MNRVQAALKNQLMRQNERLELDLKEKAKMKINSQNNNNFIIACAIQTLDFDAEEPAKGS